MKHHISDTCELICEDNGQKFVVDILSFRENQHLVVALEKSVKIELHWNRKIYEGFLGGKSFVSDGPCIQTVRKGR